MKKREVKRLLSIVMSLAMIFSMLLYPAMTIQALDDEDFGTNTEEISEVEESGEDKSDVLEESETYNLVAGNDEDIFGELLDEDFQKVDDVEELEPSNDDVMTLLEKRETRDEDSNLGTAISEDGGSLADGSYYLNDNIILTNDLMITGTVTIDLNGHTLTGSGQGPVITNSGVLTLKDSSTTKEGVLKGGNSDNGGALSNSGSFILESGTITGNSGNYSVYYGTGKESSFTMMGGTITGNTASIASIRVGGSLTMNGGSITSNQGKAIYLSSGSFNMNGGLISANQATATSTNGGAVYVSGDSLLTMSAGVIMGNTAGYGGGIYFDGSASVSRTNSINGGAVYGNKATVEGSDIVINNGYGLSLMSGETMSADGYTFKGWYDDSRSNRYSQNDNPAYYGSLTTGSEENYALITAYGYKLIYDVAQGTGTVDEGFLDLAKPMASITVASGEGLTAPEGQCFSGWNTSLDGTGNSYKPGQEMSLTQNTTLYGQYGPHSLVKTDASEATCTTAGSKEYWQCSSCQKCFSSSEGTNEIAPNSWLIPALKHNYSLDNVTFNWSEGYDKVENLNSITCQATFTCSAGDEAKTVDCTVDHLTDNDHKATCTSVADYDIKASAVLSNPRDEQVLSVSESKIIYGVKLGHQWSEDASGVTFNWSEDGKTCLAAVACLREDCNVTLTQNLTEKNGITSTIKTLADCINDEVKSYTANVTFIDENESSGNQNVGPFSDSKDVSQSGTALKHHYTIEDVTFNWAKDNDSNDMLTKAAFICSAGDDTKEVDCTIERLNENDQEATCTSEDSYVLKATATLSNPRDGETLTTSENKTFTGSKLGHLWPSDNEGADFKWSDDGTSCTVTITCQREGCDQTLIQDLNNENGIVESVKKEADCVNDKVLTYTLSASFTDENENEGNQNIGPYTSSKDVVQEDTALKHNYTDHNVSFTWPSENNDVDHLNEMSATAIFTCSAGDDTKEVNCTIEHVTENDHPVTCTTADDYYIKATATLTNPRDGALLTASENEILYGSKLGHMWPADSNGVAFNWSDDNKTCIASLTCQREGCDKTLTEELSLANGITSTVLVQPNCVTHAVLNYTATVTFTDDNEDEGKQIVGPYENSKEGTLKDELKAHIYNQEQVVFNWIENENGSLNLESATFTCLDCHHEETAKASATSQKMSNPTCEGNGTTLYHASASILSRDDITILADNEKTASFPQATGHNYDFKNAEFEWAKIKDGWDCQAIVICLNDDTHKETIDCDVTSKMILDPSCEGQGLASYQASFTVDDQTYNSDETKTLPVDATGHNWQVVDSTIVEEGQKEFMITYKCDSCQSVKEDKHVIESHLDNSPIISDLKWNDLISMDDLFELLKDGSEINLDLSVGDLNEDVSDVEKEMIEDKMNELYDDIEYAVSYLDINVSMYIEHPDGQEDVRGFSKTLNPVTINVDIPDTLSAFQGDDYTVIRIHDGEATQLDCLVENNVLSFTSDQFSTYALIKYKSGDDDLKKEDIITDIIKPEEGNKSDHKEEDGKATDRVNTGDENMMLVTILKLGLSLAGLCFLCEKKRPYNK